MSPQPPQPENRYAGLGLLLACGLVAAGLAVADGVGPRLGWLVLIPVGLSVAVAWRILRPSTLGTPSTRVTTNPARDRPLPYERMIDALPDPVLLISAQEPDDITGRRFILANEAARDLLRLTSGTGLLVTAIRDPQVLEAVDEALFGGVDSQAMYEVGGVQTRIFQAFAKPLGETPDGALLALLVLRDETDSRRAEQTRADFLANASHELRTPLASLSGFIETLRGHAKTDEGARERFLTIMQTQADRMARLIDDLLSLSRIELNEHIPPQGETDLTLAARDVIDALGPLARGRGVDLVAELPPLATATVAGDRDQIVQVVQNLVDNALKYSPAGGSVRIALRSGLTTEAATAPLRPDAARLPLLTPDHGHRLFAVLQVSDSGLGLKREHLPRLTERFYRVEGQKSGDRPGTGLGLAIVKHIMNRHRGGMGVESVEGEGTTFSVYFPWSPSTVVEHESWGGVTKLS